MILVIAPRKETASLHVRSATRGALDARRLSLV
jgi:hypothetical protein